MRLFHRPNCHIPGALRVHHAGSRVPTHRALQHHPTPDGTVDRAADNRSVSLGYTPCYLLRDRDSLYGTAFESRVKNLGMKEVKIAPRSPWQNPYCERVIGSIRRECLDDMIVCNEWHLHRVLQSYVDYYHHWRTYRSLEMDAPEPRAVQPPELGVIRKLPVGFFRTYLWRRRRMDTGANPNRAGFDNAGLVHA
jgi:transposase InsO family protein